MYCIKCGANIQVNSKFCSACGYDVQTPRQNKGEGKEKLVGFSSRINDPAFTGYVKNSKRWSAIFSLVLAIVAIISFYIYGEKSPEMDNPQALYIGIGIGSMFIFIATIQIIGRSRSKTWDGIVIDKKVQDKRKKRYTNNNDYYWENYKEYTVSIKRDDGRVEECATEDDDTKYNYYQIGDRVRHHEGLNTYEKYDKSRDAIIFCNACASLHNIEDDYCFRCKCPLLK